MLLLKPSEWRLTLNRVDDSSYLNQRCLISREGRESGGIITVCCSKQVVPKPGSACEWPDLGCKCRGTLKSSVAGLRPESKPICN